jgi:pSer/pThr/pTyr-binding forkhead associated (FHA) protein
MKNPPHIVVQLIHIHGGLKGQIQEFSDPLITIGRLPSYALPFPADEPGVSREHARIEREGNQFRLVALKDKFGTFVNGKQVREAVLRNGDVIEFGSGGPKVSFNTEIGEPVAEPVAEPVPPPRPQTRPAAAPVSEVPEPEPQPQPRREAPRPSLPASGAGKLPEEVPRSLDLPLQRTSAPLIIQFGPTIWSYRELPVLIGAHARCDFVLQQAGIQDQHAQIFFHQGNYFVKDLTGQGLLKVNGRPIAAPARLNQSDEIECGPHGPVFRFLGEGRLAEIDAAQPDERFAPRTHDGGAEPRTDPPGKAPPAGFLSRFIRGFK